jgi:RimJ/RimL family protein N-acetyltransferase
MAKAFQQQGYMEEAFSELSTYFLKNKIVHRIEGQVHIDNRIAQSLLLKLGFKQEGRLRENFLVNGKYYDSILFSLLESDLE